MVAIRDLFASLALRFYSIVRRGNILFLEKNARTYTLLSQNAIGMCKRAAFWIRNNKKQNKLVQHWGRVANDLVGKFRSEYRFVQWKYWLRFDTQIYWQ